MTTTLAEPPTLTDAGTPIYKALLAEHPNLFDYRAPAGEIEIPAPVARGGTVDVDVELVQHPVVGGPLREHPAPCAQRPASPPTNTVTATVEIPRIATTPPAPAAAAPNPWFTPRRTAGVAA
ncbi:hypothetical protein [Nonomuraea cavernae]|uniref:hypothetical protein n=1 Tax=Nonomuraea cavernae TaxID=2045107 RepID=UPI0033D61BF8